MSDPKKHQLRFSIDVRSIKDHQFTAQLYLKYPAIPSLGIKQFKSSPTISVNNPKAEFNFSANCFASGFFEAGPGEVETKLSEQLVLEFWHNDRLKKDVFLGRSEVDIKRVLTEPLRKKKECFTRVLDAYVPIDEVDQDGNSVKKIGAVRVILFLEDLGPIQLLKQSGFDIRDLIEENDEALVDDPKLPSENMANKFEGSAQQRMQLNELEYKVVWELETWKKAEEAKTRITLKQKEIQFWTNLSEQQRKSDIEKEKHFKKLEANLNLLETKLKGKMSELAKREQKIVLFEQELQNKINQVSKECLQKDQEIERVKRKSKEDKSSMLKQKSILEIELAKYKAENARLKVELEEAKKQDERSPLNLLKQEVNTKALENKELSKELEKCNEVKEEYKLYYEKMKNEVITLRDKLREKEESLREMKYEKEILLNNYKNLEQKLNFEIGNRNRQQYQYYQQPMYDVSYEDEMDHGNQGYAHMSERDRMIKARQDLIDQGLYNPNDQLIKEYDRNIASMS